MKELYDLPFPLAYIDWCKEEKGIKKLVDTENKKLVDEFYLKKWKPHGKDVNGLEYAIARGLI